MEIKQSANRVDIEGILVSTHLKKGRFQRDRETKETIGGSIIVRVDQEINGKKITSDIPVHMFSTKYTKTGNINPSYESIETIMNDFVSIAAAGNVEGADKVTLTGDIRMNEYVGRDGKTVSFPRIHASFAARVKGEYAPKANFDVTFAVLKKEDERDKEGNETGRYMVKGAVIQYGGKADVVPFFVVNSNAINFISTYWDEGTTVRATGKLNFTSRKETVVTEVDFGEPQKRERTISISDLIITGGSNPIDPDSEDAYKEEEIKEALAVRLAAIEKMKNKPAKANVAPPKTSFGIDSLGF